MRLPATAREWDESTSAPEQLFAHTDAVFESLFQRSADAIWLYDPQTDTLVDCNQAAVKLVGAQSKELLLPIRPGNISPAVQPDGSRSADKLAEMVAAVEKQSTHCFEWIIQRLDGSQVPVEVSATAVLMEGKSIHVAISRDISERKKAERQ